MVFKCLKFSYILLLGLAVCLCAGGLCLATPGEAYTTDTAAQGKDILRLLEAKYKETKTFTGEFEQLKVSEMFLEEIRSEGRFWYEKPGKFRCEYLPPNEQVNLILDDVAYMYIPEIKQVEVYRFKSEDSPIKKLNQMLLGFGVSVEDVLEVYHVRSLPEEETGDLFALHFKPRSKEEGLNFESIKLWVKKKNLVPARLLFLEPGGDTTRIELEKVEFNRKIKPSVFKPDFPEDAEVIEQNG